MDGAARKFRSALPPYATPKLTFGERLLLTPVHRAVRRPRERLVAPQHEREVADAQHVDDDLLLVDVDRELGAKVVEARDLEPEAREGAVRTGTTHEKRRP